MATTLRIDDRLYRDAKAAAAQQGITVTRYIEEALKLKLRSGQSAGRAPVVLPTYASGKGFPYSPQELKQLIQKSATAADRTKVKPRRRRG